MRGWWEREREQERKKERKTFCQLTWNSTQSVSQARKRLDGRVGAFCFGFGSFSATQVWSQLSSSCINNYVCLDFDLLLMISQVPLVSFRFNFEFLFQHLFLLFNCSLLAFVVWMDGVRRQTCTLWLWEVRVKQVGLLVGSGEMLLLQAKLTQPYHSFPAS